MKYVMLKKRSPFPCTLFSGSGFLLYLSVCVLWIVFLCSPVHAQSPEKLATFSEKGKDDGVTLAETGVTIKPEDVEKARIRAGKVKANADKSIKEIESLISTLESDAETTTIYLEALQREKKSYQAAAINPEFLEVLDKGLGIVKQKVDVDNEQIQAYKDQIAALQNQAKIYADRIMLLDSVMKMSDTLAVIPSDQLSTIKKEADIAKGFITAVQADLREKETLVSHFIKELEEVKVRLSVKEQDLAKNLESLRAKIQEEALIKVAQEKIKGIVAWKKTVNAQWVAIFERRLETAGIRYDEAVQALKNAELNSAFLAEKARRLEEKQKTEELKKKQAELEVAKKAEEITQKVAEVTRAEAEKTIQETARKTEEIAQEQMVTTSPERVEFCHRRSVSKKYY